MQWQDGAMELHRGRLIDRLQLVTTDLATSKKFYSAVLAVLGIPIGGDGPGFFWADELCVSSVESPASAGRPTGRTHFALQAADRATVERFHREAVAAGGKDNGAPGERPYHPGYYAAFVLDPDGNNVEVVFHGEAQRSASSPNSDICFFSGFSTDGAFFVGARLLFRSAAVSTSRWPVSSWLLNSASTVAIESASAGCLSSRMRRMRGKRSAYPLL